MKYLGDFRLGDTFDTKFTTTAAATGAPTTLAGTPVISAYVGNSITQITAGITLTVDFDTVPGLHNVRVVATSGNGYATASNYQLVITTGTVGGTSAVGYVIAEFSIEARSALMPTTAARTLDVSATGEAGLDWANVGGATTAVSLTNTTVATVTTATTATSVTTVNGLAAGVITAASIAADAITDAKVAADVTIASVTGAVGSVTGSVGSVTGAVGSVTGLTASNLDATVSSRATPAQILTTALTESYAADGAAPTVAQALFQILGREYEFAIAGDTMTVKKLDGLTTAMTFTLAPAGGPYTSITRTT